MMSLGTWTLTSDSGADVMRAIMIKWHQIVHPAKDIAAAKAQGKPLDYGAFVTRLHLVASGEEVSAISTAQRTALLSTHEEKLPSHFKWACFEVDAITSLVQLFKLQGKTTADLTTDGAKGFGHAWIDRSHADDVLTRAVAQLATCGHPDADKIQMKNAWQEEGIEVDGVRYVVPITIELTKEMDGISKLETGTAMMRLKVKLKFNIEEVGAILEAWPVFTVCGLTVLGPMLAPFAIGLHSAGSASAAVPYQVGRDMASILTYVKLQMVDHLSEDQLQPGVFDGIATTLIKSWEQPEEGNAEMKKIQDFWNQIVANSKVVLPNKKKIGETNIESNQKSITDLSRLLSKRKAPTTR